MELHLSTGCDLFNVISDIVKELISNNLQQADVKRYQ